jgi:hypothetical protein
MLAHVYLQVSSELFTPQDPVNRLAVSSPESPLVSADCASMCACGHACRRVRVGPGRLVCNVCVLEFTQALESGV